MGYEALALAAVAAASAMYTGYTANKAAEESAKAQKEAAAMQAAAGEESKRVAEENAQRIEMEGEEQQRRLAEKMEQEQATSRARAAASGAVYDPADENSTLATVVKAQADENARQLAWERRATASQAEIERRRGKYAQQSALWQAAATRRGAKTTQKQGQAALIGGILGAGKAVGQGAYDYNAATVDPKTGKGNIETWWNNYGQGDYATASNPTGMR